MSFSNAEHARIIASRGSPGFPAEREKEAAASIHAPRRAAQTPQCAMHGVAQPPRRRTNRLIDLERRARFGRFGFDLA
jgi:hypothetical protein